MIWKRFKAQPARPFINFYEPCSKPFARKQSIQENLRRQRAGLSGSTECKSLLLGIPDPLSPIKTVFGPDCSTTVTG
jgi:hypothetical protein